MYNVYLYIYIYIHVIISDDARDVICTQVLRTYIVPLWILLWRVSGR